MPQPIVIVDAENVRRSRWPNLSPADLVTRARAWAAGEGFDLLVVFDGPAPQDAPDLIASRPGESADDRIAEIAERLTNEGSAYWLVTSDRGLRARAADGAARVVGGGSFLSLLQRDSGTVDD
jgi:hypothetical protein